MVIDIERSRKNLFYQIELTAINHGSFKIKSPKLKIKPLIINSKLTIAFFTLNQLIRLKLLTDQSTDVVRNWQFARHSDQILKQKSQYHP